MNKKIIPPTAWSFFLVIINYVNVQLLMVTGNIIDNILYLYGVLLSMYVLMDDPLNPIWHGFE